MDFIYQKQEEKNKSEYKEMKQCPKCGRVVKEVIRVERINTNNHNDKELINPNSPLGKIFSLFSKKNTLVKEKYFFVCEKCEREVK